MADLYVKEFDMANPLIIASSPATQGVAAVLKSGRTMPGAIVMRNFGHGAGGGSLVQPSAAAMLAGQPASQSHAEGTSIKDFFNTLEEYCEGVKQARRGLSGDIKLWASVGHFSDTVRPGVDWENEWIRQARELELAGADALELHFNTPGVSVCRDRVYDFYRLVFKSTRMIKAEVKIPVMVKLPVEACDPLRAMEAASFAGADAIGPTARWKSFDFELDLNSTLARVGAGYGTSHALPIICYNVAEARKNGVTTPMYAGGGVFTWQAAAKIIMAGSQLAQLGSLSCCIGPAATTTVLNGLSKWMDENGYADMPSLCGKALDLFNISADKADARRNALGDKYREIQVDTSRCVGCGKCEEACWYEGIEITNRKAAKTQKCIGCGYCFPVCPTGALELNARETIAAATNL